MTATTPSPDPAEPASRASRDRTRWEARWKAAEAHLKSRSEGFQVGGEGQRGPNPSTFDAMPSRERPVAVARPAGGSTPLIDPVARSDPDSPSTQDRAELVDASIRAPAVAPRVDPSVRPVPTPPPTASNRPGPGLRQPPAAGRAGTHLDRVDRPGETRGYGPVPGRSTRIRRAERSGRRGA